MSYIEREKIINGLELSIASWSRDCNSSAPIMANAYRDMLSRVKNYPAADVVEVRHGKWIKGRKEKLYYNDDMSGFYDFPVTCSVCKFDITDEGFYETDYCPNCGAKMDGDTK